MEIKEFLKISLHLKYGLGIDLVAC